MTFKLPKSAGDFEVPPQGTHEAICYRVLDLGTHVIEFKGKRKSQRKVMLSFEYAKEMMKDGRPFTIHQRFTLSSSKKATLRKLLEGWKGSAFTDAELEAFDMSKLIGKGGLMGVIHNENDGTTYANISMVIPLPKGTKAPKPQNETACLILTPEDFDEVVFDSLSDNLKETIKASPEYQELYKDRSTTVNGTGEAVAADEGESANW